MSHRIAFNALSVDNLSGRHVFLGHVRQVLRASHSASRRHLLLHHAGNRDLAQALGGGVEAIECSPATRSWRTRWWWESTELPRLMKSHGVDFLFSPAGVRSTGVDVPQLVLAQNPWCLVPEVHTGIVDHLKAAAQRYAYADAQRKATLMLFNSDYMRRVYEANAGSAAKEARLLLQGIDDANFERGHLPLTFDERRTEIVLVSVMARHKAVQDVVAALASLRKQGVDASLSLVGPWVDPGYERFIRSQVAEQGLERHVAIEGKVSNEQLLQHYARARVFCLLSRCESFGIPAVEAQAFGTPCVVADAGAPPEISGPGGVVVAAGDIPGAARALGRLLTERQTWDERSRAARTNVERFRWERCSQPLVDWLSEHGALH